MKAAFLVLLGLFSAPPQAAAATQPNPAIEWFDDSGLTQPALNLLDAMSRAPEWGLDPRDYGAVAILSESRSANSPARRAQLNETLSAAATRFVSHLHYGRIDPKTVGFDMPVRAHSFDAQQVLKKLAVTRDTRGELATVEPAFQHYAFLKEQLAKYRALATVPGLTQLPAFKARTIAAGEPYSGAPALRGLLVALGDLPATERVSDADATLDAHLVDALRRFQFRHGLKQDGALGRQTYAALTVPMTTRVRQIELTLERWRWLPALDAPTIIVNIPQFRLFAFPSASDREAQMVTMDVIVGQTFPRTRTPVFSADLRYVEFQPYWDVPYGIMSRELLPLIRSRSNYLAAHDLEIVEAGGSLTQSPTEQQLADLAAGKSRLRQRPGAQNALGPVKFVLPNPYNVYLHSTPANELFKASRRAFSHGCIRVSDPVALAEYVLHQASGNWTREQIVAAMQGPATQRIDLKQSIRVLIVYGTAVATEKGLIYFFDDLYGNDARLARALRMQ